MCGYTELWEEAEVLEQSVAHGIPNGEILELKDEVEEEPLASPRANYTIPAVTVTPVFPRVSELLYMHFCHVIFQAETTLQREREE